MTHQRPSSKVVVELEILVVVAMFALDIKRANDLFLVRVVEDGRELTIR